MENDIVTHIKKFSASCGKLREFLKDRNQEVLNEFDPSELKEIGTNFRKSDLRALDFLKLFEDFSNAAKTSKFLREQGRVSGPKGDSSKNEKGIDTETNSLLSAESKRFRVFLDVTNFPPKEVKVKFCGNYLVIHAGHGKIADHHGICSREFTRKFEIPEDVDRGTFKACVDPYHVLIIEAAFKPKIEKNKSLPMLVETCGGVRGLPPYEDVGPKFLEILEHQINDGKAMADLCRMLAAEIRLHATIPQGKVY